LDKHLNGNFASLNKPMRTEIIIPIDGLKPIDFFGPNHANILLLEQAFPQLSIIARGNEIKAIGDQDSLDELEKIIQLMLNHFEKKSIINRDTVMNLLNTSGKDTNFQLELEVDNDILVHGRSGKAIKARTPNQMRMVESLNNNDILFAIGPAGTGKTYTAVALAVRALKNKDVRRIILTRPAVEAGESLGFLPGDLRDKLDPYLQPLYDALRDMIPQQKLVSLFEDGTIEIAPLGFMRGRTLDQAFVILDEAQNTTSSQLKMFLTRMGKDAKFIINGDITQIDLPKNQKSGLLDAQRILGDIQGMEFIHLDENDVVRHRLVTKIIQAYSKINQ
jgi:phosphate starvation-inducible PhoH-like protein